MDAVGGFHEVLLLGALQHTSLEAAPLLICFLSRAAAVSITCHALDTIRLSHHPCQEGYLFAGAASVWSGGLTTAVDLCSPEAGAPLLSGGASCCSVNGEAASLIGVMVSTWLGGSGGALHCGISRGLCSRTSIIWFVMSAGSLPL